jgi:hypothetical protein
VGWGRGRWRSPRPPPPGSGCPTGRDGGPPSKWAGTGGPWHTVNDAVIAYGEVLVDHPDRFGIVEALGLDETLFCRQGQWHHQSWSSSIVDVTAGQLLDVVEAGRPRPRQHGWRPAASSGAPG